jgi:ribonucleoside-triphosphate reductase
MAQRLAEMHYGEPNLMNRSLSPLSDYIHISRYARFIPEENRRETWAETVNRYITFFKERNPDLKGIPWDELEQAILDQEVMPSMRAMMTAGKALDKDNVAGYNCAYAAVDNPRVFDEAMYILMCGTGFGFSVERQYVNLLPDVPDTIYPTDTTIVVADSKKGWATAYKQLIAMLYDGNLPKIDYSRIRPAGARLKTFGGRASGPDPLMSLFEFTIDKFMPSRNNGTPNKGIGRKLTSLECHDIMCKVAEIVVCGGVRRSALISLSNLSDERMQRAKHGNFGYTDPQRYLANNSTCYTEKPELPIFLREWMALIESKNGERGVFSRPASKKMSPERRDTTYDFGTNPCAEIILRSKQFCNLSEVMVRNGDTLETLKRKVRLASILGTLQATVVDFKYLSAAWKKNTMEERLLGVSLTGIMDHATLSATTGHTKSWLAQMKQVAVDTNIEFSEMLDIPQAAAVTCVKPSGTVSLLTNSASGIHPRYSQYYNRTARQDMKDPLADWMIEKGFPHEPEFRTDGSPPTNWVFSFPVKGPAGSVFRNDMSAMDQLEHWKLVAEHWCEHKPSITVYVRDDEWLKVGAWVYDNFDIVSGISFLPYDGGNYKQAPYQELDLEGYKELMERMPSGVKFDSYTEEDDHTVASQSLACTSGVCEL